MQEQMTKQDAIEYLLYLKHDVQAKSPMDIALDTAIEALKQPTIEAEPVRHGRMIDKDEAIKILCDGCTADCDVPYTACITVQKIIDMPTIESEPVRHGRWIDTPLPNSRVAKCSLCGFWQRTNGDDKTGKHLIHNAVYRYCAGCGAKMDGGADNG